MLWFINVTVFCAVVIRAQIKLLRPLGGSNMRKFLHFLKFIQIIFISRTTKYKKIMLTLVRISDQFEKTGRKQFVPGALQRIHSQQALNTTCI